MNTSTHARPEGEAEPDHPASDPNNAPRRGSAARSRATRGPRGINRGRTGTNGGRNRSDTTAILAQSEASTGDGYTLRSANANQPSGSSQSGNADGNSPAGDDYLFDTAEERSRREAEMSRLRTLRTAGANQTVLGIQSGGSASTATGGDGYSFRSAADTSAGQQTAAGGNSNPRRGSRQRGNPTGLSRGARGSSGGSRGGRGSSAPPRQTSSQTGDAPHPSLPTMGRSGPSPPEEGGRPVSSGESGSNAPSVLSSSTVQAPVPANTPAATTERGSISTDNDLREPERVPEAVLAPLRSAGVLQAATRIYNDFLRQQPNSGEQAHTGVINVQIREIMRIYQYEDGLIDVETLAGLGPAASAVHNAIVPRGTYSSDPKGKMAPERTIREPRTLPESTLATLRGAPTYALQGASAAYNGFLRNNPNRGNHAHLGVRNETVWAIMQIYEYEDGLIPLETLNTIGPIGEIVYNAAMAELSANVPSVAPLPDILPVTRNDGPSSESSSENDRPTPQARPAGQYELPLRPLQTTTGNTGTSSAPQEPPPAPPNQANISHFTRERQAQIHAQATQIVQNREPKNVPDDLLLSDAQYICTAVATYNTALAEGNGARANVSVTNPTVMAYVRIFQVEDGLADPLVLNMIPHRASLTVRAALNSTPVPGTATETTAENVAAPVRNNFGTTIDRPNVPYNPTMPPGVRVSPPDVVPTRSQPLGGVPTVSSRENDGSVGSLEQQLGGFVIGNITRGQGELADSAVPPDGPPTVQRSSIVARPDESRDGDEVNPHRRRTPSLTPVLSREEYVLVVGFCDDLSEEVRREFANLIDAVWDREQRWDEYGTAELPDYIQTKLLDFVKAKMAARRRSVPRARIRHSMTSIGNTALGSARDTRTQQPVGRRVSMFASGGGSLFDQAEGRPGTAPDSGQEFQFEPRDIVSGRGVTRHAWTRPSQTEETRDAPTQPPSFQIPTIPPRAAPRQAATDGRPPVETTRPPVERTSSFPASYQLPSSTRIPLVSTPSQPLQEGLGVREGDPTRERLAQAESDLDDCRRESLVLTSQRNANSARAREMSDELENCKRDREALTADRSAQATLTTGLQHSVERLQARVAELEEELKTRPPAANPSPTGDVPCEQQLAMALDDLSSSREQVNNLTTDRDAAASRLMPTLTGYRNRITELENRLRAHDLAPRRASNTLTAVVPRTRYFYDAAVPGYYTTEGDQAKSPTDIEETCAQMMERCNTALANAKTLGDINSLQAQDLEKAEKDLEDANTTLERQSKDLADSVLLNPGTLVRSDVEGTYDILQAEENGEPPEDHTLVEWEDLVDVVNGLLVEKTNGGEKMDNGMQTDFPESAAGNITEHNSLQQERDQAVTELAAFRSNAPVPQRVLFNADEGLYSIATDDTIGTGEEIPLATLITRTNNLVETSRTARERTAQETSDVPSHGSLITDLQTATATAASERAQREQAELTIQQLSAQRERQIVIDYPSGQATVVDGDAEVDFKDTAHGIDGYVLLMNRLSQERQERMRGMSTGDCGYPPHNILEGELRAANTSVDEQKANVRAEQTSHLATTERLITALERVETLESEVQTAQQDADDRAKRIEEHGCDYRPHQDVADALVFEENAHDSTKNLLATTTAELATVTEQLRISRETTPQPGGHPPAYQAALQSLQRDLDDAREDLEDARKDLEDATTQRSINSLEDHVAEHERLQAKLRDAEKKDDDYEAEIIDAIAQLTSRVESAESGYAALMTSAEEPETCTIAEHQHLQAERDRLEAERDLAEADYNSLYDYTSLLQMEGVALVNHFNLKPVDLD